MKKTIKLFPESPKEEIREQSPQSTTTEEGKFSFEGFSSRTSTPDFLAPKENKATSSLKPAVSTKREVPTAPLLPGMVPLGMAPPLPGQAKKNISNDLTEEDFNETLSGIRQKINQLSVEDIVNNNLIKKAADHYNPFIAHRLIEIITKNNNPSIRASLLQGVEALIMQAKNTVKIEEDKLAELAIEKANVKSKYDQIRATPLDHPSIQEALKEVIKNEKPYKKTPSRAMEYERNLPEVRRTKAVNLAFPNLDQQQEVEQNQKDQVYEAQKDKIMKTQKIFPLAIKVALKSEIINQGDLGNALAAARNDKLAREIMPNLINSVQQYNNSQTEKPKKKNQIVQEVLPSLSQETNNLINTYKDIYGKLQNVKDKDSPESKAAAKNFKMQIEEVEENIVDGILADIVPLVIKLDKLEAKLAETGNSCINLNNLIDISLNSHVKNAFIIDKSNFQEDINAQTFASKIKELLIEGRVHPLNIEAVDYTAPNSLEEIKTEIQNILENIGVRREAINFTSPQLDNDKEKTITSTNGKTTYVEKYLNTNINKTGISL